MHVCLSLDLNVICGFIVKFEFKMTATGIIVSTVGMNILTISDLSKSKIVR